jgi:putative phage-type endonuclease
VGRLVVTVAGPVITGVPSARVAMHSYATREEWLAARLHGIGSSEAPAVMGVSPWVSRYQLWAEKCGLVTRESPGTGPARWGLLLERTIAEEYERETGRRLIDLGSFTVCRSLDRPFLFATHDRVIESVAGRGPGILSIKTADKSKGDQWPGPHGPPLDYQVQLQHELAVSGYEWGAFAVLIGGNDFRTFDIERNPDFIEKLENECFRFWHEVEAGIAPAVDASDATTKTIRRLYPTDDGQTVYLPDEASAWDRERDEALAMIRDGKHRQQLAENQITSALGTATYGLLPGGARYVFKAKSRKGYTHTVQPATWRELRRQDGEDE